MAKTRDYMDYLDDNVTIAPATSQEEYQAAKTIADVLRDHNLETRVEEFEAHPWSRTIPPVLVLVMIVCLVVAKAIDGPVRFVALLLSALPVALSLISHFSGLSLYENLGPSSKSQNVVAVHRAVGDKVVKGARPIVVVAHYDTPRKSILRQGPLARYQATLRVVSIPCYMAIAVSILVQAIVVLPESVRTAMWVIGLIAAFPLLFLAIAELYDSFASYTQGSNDNKASVAALLSIASKVRPVQDRVDELSKDDTHTRASRRRVNDTFEDQPVPQLIKIVEEIKGVRHGAEVLTSLGILPPTCEVVYEEPRVQMVEQVATEVISAQGASDDVDEVSGALQYESGHEQSEPLYSEESMQDDNIIDPFVQEQAYEDDYEEEGGFGYEEEDYEEESYDDEFAKDDEEEYEEKEDDGAHKDESYEDEYVEEEEYEEEEDDEYEEEEYEEEEEDEYEEYEGEEQGFNLESIGSWFSMRLTGVKEFFERNRISLDKAGRGEDYAEEYDDEYLDEYESWDEDYEDGYDEEFEDDNVVGQDTEQDDAENPVAEEYVDEDEEIEQHAEEEPEDDSAEEEESAKDVVEEQVKEEESMADSEKEEASVEVSETDEDESEGEQETGATNDNSDVVEDEIEEEAEEDLDEDLDEDYYAEEDFVEEDFADEDYEEDESLDDYEEYDEEDLEEHAEEDSAEEGYEIEDYEEKVEEDYEDEDDEDDTEDDYEEETYEENFYDHEQGVRLTIGERISKFFKKIRIGEAPIEETQDSEITAGKEYRVLAKGEEEYETEEGYAGVFEDAYDEEDLYETYEDELDFGDEEGYGEEDYDEEEYEEEDYGYEEFYEEDYDELDYDEDLDEPYYEEEDSDDSEADFEEGHEDASGDVRLPDPDMLHFDHEYDEDIAPKDTTGIDVISDSYDLYTNGSARIQTYQKPEPVSDPSWGVSTYQPPVPSMNIARRAALFDLPDPSAASIDPLDDDYEEYDDEYDDEYEEYDDDYEEYDDNYEEYDDEYDEYEEATQDDLSTDESIDEPGLGVSDDTDADMEQQTFWGKGDWKGGATVRDNLRNSDVPIVIDADDLQDAILELGDDYLVAHDIWFVATGSSEYEHAGIKAFMEEHRKDIRGAFLVNLDCVGAGGLSIIVREGLHAPRRADRRLVRMITSIAQDLHIQLDTAMFNWGECESATSMRSRIRSVTIAGLDENNLPALSHSANDLPENVDPKQVSDVVRIVTELIRRS